MHSVQILVLLEVSLGFIGTYSIINKGLQADTHSLHPMESKLE